MHSNAIESSLFSLVFDQASFLAFVTDREGTILRASRYAEELIGRELSGLPFADILINFAQAFNLEQALAAAGTQLLSVTMQNGKPQTFCFHFDDCGERILALGDPTHHDNEALHSSLIALNGEVSNLNRELQKKTVELEKLNELKSRFIGTTAHDLRNPIGGIYGLSKLLMEEATASGDERYAEIFTEMRGSTGFMLGLIENLLSAVTIESGVMQLTLEATDLNELIASNVRRNRIVADARGIGLHVAHAEPLPAIQLDRLKMHQVLNNLISNAVKFSARGSVVTVSAARESTAVVVAVEDRGPGIPASEFQKLFTPFQQTTVRSPDGEAGSGLGLSIVKAIVEEHGGRIGVESEVGVGTTFRVWLPLPTARHPANKEFSNDQG
ncbi:MAG: PAS domain-containing sensor histidine kinase [Spirochaetaceae bacterium]|nr:MAG: PAS domain-containing sensor histidine kinase [Spirochaetaceae bacterium]